LDNRVIIIPVQIPARVGDIILFDQLFAAGASKKDLHRWCIFIPAEAVFIAIALALSSSRRRQKPVSSFVSSRSHALQIGFIVPTFK
jgi:hypothetical protein